MKIAYLAPELPALSATFVYNEILQLEAMGETIVPFSVHKVSLQINEPRVAALAQRTFPIYGQAKFAVFMANIEILLTHPIRYLKTLRQLCIDIWQFGPCSRTAMGLGYRMLYGASFAKHLLSYQCEHIHVHFAHIATDIAMYASSLSQIPYSVTAHANDIYQRGWLLKEKVARAKFFVTISHFNQSYLANKGVAVDKVKVVRCGVDFSRFEQSPRRVVNNIVKIGVVARLVEKKGIDTLIRAVALMKARQQQLELHIAGSGPLAAQLKLLAQQSGLTPSEVHFLDAIPHADVARFIHTLDIFVLPCKQDENGDVDGIPVVLMEAMLSGVPVISSKLSGIPELVINEKTGLLIKQNDAHGLALAISRLIHDRELTEKLVKQAVSMVKQEFSLIENTKKLHALFKSDS